MSNAATIRRGTLPLSAPFADAIEAGAAQLEGNPARSATRLEAAVEGFDGAGMALYREAARARLAGLVGGDGGAALRARSDAWLSGQGVRRPLAMLGLAAPGWAPG